MSRNQRILVVVGLAISVIFLAVAFNGLNPAAVLDSIRSVNPALLIAAALWYFAAVAVIAARWGFLLLSAKRLPLSTLFRLVCIAYMGNNVYPLRAGEVLRIALLRRDEGIPLARITTTVLVERIFDGLVMLTFIVVALPLTGIASEQVNAVAAFAAPIFGMALLVFFVLAAQPGILRRLVLLVSRVLPGKLGDVARDMGEDVINGLAGLRTPAHLAGTVAFSYITWMLEASVYWIVAFAFGLQVSYPLMLLVVGVVNLAGLIPASPGQIGVYEFFVILVLTAAGVPDTTATAFALVVHVVIWLPVTLLGFYFLVRRGLGFGALAHAEELQQGAVSS